MVQGNEGKDEDVLQQHKREDTEEHRGDSNGGSNCAQPRKDRKRGGNTNLTVPDQS